MSNELRAKFEAQKAEVEKQAKADETPAAKSDETPADAKAPRKPRAAKKS